MATSRVTPTPWEDPLVYLKTSRVVTFERGQIIYNDDQPCTNLYLIVSGKVKISRSGDDGRPILIDIYCSEEFFGEAAFLHLPRRGEEARAVETTSVMSWTMAEIEQTILEQPQLGIALVQILTRRVLEGNQRIQSLSVEKTGTRLARSLMRFSERLGTREEDGTVRMMSFSHQLLAQYVGTSREIMTVHMNRFRRQGLLTYSRKAIRLRPSAFDEWRQAS